MIKQKLEVTGNRLASICSPQYFAFEEESHLYYFINL
jgi:hypothetical protein